MLIEAFIELGHAIMGTFSQQPVRLAIVRRYEDANGNYVGELYMGRENKTTNAIEYDMIGASLDSLPLDESSPVKWGLNMRDHFLAQPMALREVRVGALDPKDNDAVRRLVAKLPRRRMTLKVQNSFAMPLFRLRKPC